MRVTVIRRASRRRRIGIAATLAGVDREPAARDAGWPRCRSGRRAPQAGIRTRGRHFIVPAAPSEPSLAGMRQRSAPRRGNPDDGMDGRNELSALRAAHVDIERIGS